MLMLDVSDAKTQIFQRSTDKILTSLFNDILSGLLPLLSTGVVLSLPSLSSILDILLLLLASISNRKVTPKRQKLRLNLPAN